MKSKLNLFCASLFLIMFQLVMAQNEETPKFQIHSHNDYKQNVPFWNAYTNGLNSIEVDIFLKNDTLFATHEEDEIIKKYTIENLYLQPIRKAISLEVGIPRKLQLIIDIKSESHHTLKKLISELKKYPDIITNKNISIVISGNRPNSSKYADYPDYISFDYQSLVPIVNSNTRDKIALISLNFKSFSDWNGKGALTALDYKIIDSIIRLAHSYHKPFRFWGAPDSKTAWKAFRDLGVDFINTDMPSKSSTYLNSLNKRTYFNKTIEKFYSPSFEFDKTNTPIKNIILLIRDGNGLAQISSATLANGGNLTLTQLKSIGLLKTQSADNFTTDSAAAGTALATGEKTYNRAIGVDVLGKPLFNIIEVLDKHGFVSGCITTDKITGATPASFYAHQKDRSDTTGIATDLSKSKLSLFIGGGSNDFNNGQLSKYFDVLDNISSIGKSNKSKIGYFFSKESVPSVLEGRGNILSDATKNGLQFLKNKNKPFFLMVEGAKIDSFSHLNNTSGIVSEGIDFDMAITEAIQFADKTGNTLVIVTADHETSGFSIPHGSLNNHMIEGDFTTHDHTGTMVPVFAYGPYSQEFQGVYENSDLFKKIIKVLKLKKI
jgi:alkaline phosphatase